MAENENSFPLIEYIDKDGSITVAAGKGVLSYFCHIRTYFWISYFLILKVMCADVFN